MSLSITNLSVDGGKIGEGLTLDYEVQSNSGLYDLIFFVHGIGSLHFSLSGDSDQRTLSLPLSSKRFDPGEYNYIFAVRDLAGNFENESGTFTVEGSEAELAIHEVDITPSSPEPGQEFTVEVSIEELAYAETENLTVNLSIAGTDIDQTISVDPLKGDTHTAFFDNLIIDNIGDYTLEVTVDADNAEIISEHVDFEVSSAPQPQELSVSIEDIFTSGETGSRVQIDVLVEHTGDAEKVDFTITQNGTSYTRTIDLQKSGPGLETVSAVFDNTRGFDPGAVVAEVRVKEETDEKIFGLYEDNLTRDFEWQWADIEKNPFDMIGQVVVDHDGLAPGWFGTGTGFMISPRHMMTNAHVLSDNSWSSDLSELNSVDFYLGRNGGTAWEEQNNNHYLGEHAYLQKEEWGSRWPDTDMAIVTLDREVESLNYFDWFWNSRLETDRDLSGESVFISGYPISDIDQGADQMGNSTYFQWTAHGTVTDYIQGYSGYGDESGGLKFSQSMSSTGGASGSPVIYQNNDGEYQFAGAYTGSIGAEPVAATLDPAAYDWALTIVQDYGYLQNIDLLDGPWEDMGPDKALPATDSALAYSVEGVRPAGIEVQGVPQGDLDDYSGLG